MRKDFKDYYGYDIDVIREYGPFKGFKTIKHAYDDIIDYRRECKHNYVKTFYNSDGSVNEAKVE